MTKGFASDNNSGIHPEIIKAIKEANKGHVIGYGDDPFTQTAIKIFKKEFGDNTEIFFVFNGTGSNVVCLASASQSFHSIICAETSHIEEDECGAPERFTGCKLLPVKTTNGKLTPVSIKHYLKGFNFEHHSQPKIISISQSTELGTVYKPNEIKDLADIAHKHGMFLHMDGARIANAAVSLNLPFREFTNDCGVDLLSFGGTKNGMLMGEACIIFNPVLAKNTKYIRKQSMQLFSKMRFVGAQFIAYFKNDLWKINASHANRMAKLLESEILKIPEIKITQKVESNGVFAIVPQKILNTILQEYFFYIWNEDNNEVRWMASFDTTEDEILHFSNRIKNLL